MKIETLKKNHLKKNIMIGVVAVAIISAVILNFTRAKYRVTQSIPLVNGTINYSLPDLNIVGLYIDGEEAAELDSNKTYILDIAQSTCTYKDGSEIADLSISYESETGKLTITPYTTKGTKCTLYFNEQVSASDTILANTELKTDIPDFSKTSCASRCGEETNGLYKEETSKGTTYYYRGTVDNNWVKFADFYWRIIRINEDGSLRIIYQGTSNTATGSSTQTGTSAFNSSYNNNAYVGFKYTTNNVHGTGTNSTILTALNTWYTNNLSSYASSIDGNAGFCGDRTPSTSSSSSNGSGGTGSTTTYYGGYIRLITNKQPTFECKDEDGEESDLYTTSGSSQGNKALQYPIGLITADEVAYAGGVYRTNNTSYYLYTGQNYWTMSPYNYVSSDGARVFYVNSDGSLGYSGAGWAGPGVRPVINLKSSVQFSEGNGTSDKPFVVI